MVHAALPAQRARHRARDTCRGSGARPAPLSGAHGDPVARLVADRHPERLPRAARALSLPGAGRGAHGAAEGRSEEHTSELQSLMRTSYAVFCLKNTKPYKETGLQE